MDPRRRLIAAAGAAAVLLGACNDSRSADDTMPPLATPDSAITIPDPAASTATSSATDTSAPPSSSTTASTPPTTNPATTSPPTTSVVATTVAPATSPPPPTEAPDDSETGFVLRHDGIGDVDIGDEAATVIGTFEERFGPADDDTGWQEPLASVSCTAGEFRRVTWGALSLLFTDDSGAIQGPRHFFGYEYGIVGQPGAEPSGLTTEGGVGIGSTVATLQQAYPDADVDPGEDGFMSPFFYVTDGLQGLLSGVQDDDEVTLITGGTACGL